jgi:two-component system sensor histidine kinase EvgS
MGGEMKINSEVGKGSTFEIILANIEIGQEEAIIKDMFRFDPKLIVFRDAKVLIVDDKPDNRKLIIDLLDYSSLTLLEAENGREAVEIARNQQPDLILMDLVMPEMNGIEATQELLKYDQTKSIPVMLISASAKSHTLEPGQKILFSDILSKPLNLGELVNSLKKILKYDLLESAIDGEVKQPIHVQMTGEQLTQLPELVHVLETEYMTQFQDVLQNQLINNMEAFGKSLLKFSEANNLQSLIQFANQICTYADNFDILKLTIALNQFPVIVDELKMISLKNFENEPSR